MMYRIAFVTIVFVVLWLGPVLTRTADAETVAELRQFNGVPTLFVDGEPHSGFSYMTYNPQPENFADFARLGCDLFTFSATSDRSYYGLAEDCWLAPGTYDYSQFDERVKMILDAAPGSYLVPRVYISPPSWWCDAHPDELVTMADGSQAGDAKRRAKDRRTASFGSEPWRRDAAEGLRRLIDHVDSSPFADNIIGYHVASGITEEWMYWGFQDRQFADYSPANTAAFQRWLEKKYGTNERLQSAWNDAQATFDTAAVPSEDERKPGDIGGFLYPQGSQRVIDYNLYHSWIVADTIRYFAKVVKDAADRKKLFGTFYGYSMEICWPGMGMPTSGHLALEDVLACPDIDFLTSPTSYGYRMPGDGYAIFMSMTESVKLHGKLWFDENDLRTFLVDAKTGYAGKTDTLEDTLNAQWRELGTVLAHGAAMWWFDMGGGWYDDPTLLDAIGQMRQIGGESVQHDRGSVAEIAFVVDETSPSYWHYDDRYHNVALSQQKLQLGRLGAPVDYVLLSDVGHPDLKEYKLYIFPNAFRVTPSLRDAIQRTLKRNNATALWVYAPGIIGDTVSASNCAELTGIRLGSEYETDRQPLRVRLVPDSSLATSSKVTSYGEARIAPRLYVDDDDVEVLGTFTDGKTALAARSRDGRRSIYSGAPCLPSGLLREIARDAGVHIYAENDDAFYANGAYICINANGYGTRTIRLPRPSAVRDLIQNKPVATQGGVIELNLKDKQTALFSIEEATETKKELVRSEPFELMVCKADTDAERNSEGDVIELADDRLLLAYTDFYGGKADASAARISGKISADGGRTWSGKFVLQENVGIQNVMSASLLRLRSGDVALFYLVKNSDSDLKVWMKRSSDEAVSWSEPICVTDAPGYHVMNNARVVQLDTGRLIAPVSFSTDCRKDGHYRVFCYVSDDDGVTWRKSDGELDLPKRGAMEPGIVQLKDGALLMIIRTQLGAVYRSSSTDGGLSWSDAEPMTLQSPEAPATVARIPSTGDLLMVWNNTYAAGTNHSGKRTPLTTTISRDEGQSWEHIRDIETDTEHTFAYTSITFVRDTVLLTYYSREEETGLISLKLKALPVEWLYEG